MFDAAFLSLLVAFNDVMLCDTIVVGEQFLRLLSYLFLREGKRILSKSKITHKLTNLLERESSRTNNDNDLQTGDEFQGNGTDLAVILHKLYENSKVPNKEAFFTRRKLVSESLRHLLCVSFKAKETAIKGMFV